jgi:hypothetical protein
MGHIKGDHLAVERAAAAELPYSPLDIGPKG